MIWFEMKKIFSKKTSKIGFLILLITLVITCYFAISDGSYVDENGDTHIGITAVQNLYKAKEKWAGLITEDYLKTVIRENKHLNAEYPYNPEDTLKSNIHYSHTQGISDIKTMINCAFCEFREYNYYRIDSVSESDVGNLYKNRVLNLSNWLNSDEAKYQFSEAEKSFLIEHYETLKTPFNYEPADGWIIALDYAPTIIMLTMLILSFFVSGIFANEFKWKADSIFFSTKYGRNKGTFSKLMAGYTVITAIYWIMVLLYSIVVFGIYGTSGAGCPIQISLGGWKSIYHITFFEEYILTIIGGYIGTLFILFVSMLVSAKTHSTVLSVTIPFIIIFIQSFLGGFPNLTNVLGVLPDQLLQMNMAVNTFTLYEIGGKVIGSVPILMTIYPLLCILLIPVMYRTYKKTEIK